MSRKQTCVYPSRRGCEKRQQTQRRAVRCCTDSVLCQGPGAARRRPPPYVCVCGGVLWGGGDAVAVRASRARAPVERLPAGANRPAAWWGGAGPSVGPPLTPGPSSRPRRPPHGPARRPAGKRGSAEGGAGSAGHRPAALRLGMPRPAVPRPAVPHAAPLLPASPPPAVPLPCPCRAAPHRTRLHVGSPQREVVAQQLHDERAVLVALLAQRVQLSNRLVKGLPGMRRGGGQAAGGRGTRQRACAAAPPRRRRPPPARHPAALLPPPACTCLARWQARSGEFRIS